MNHGWIATYGNDAQMSVQMSIASQGGSDTPVPDLSIEVDDVDVVLMNMERAGFSIEYGPADEPWGVRRFYVRDPFGKRLHNIRMAISLLGERHCIIRRVLTGMTELTIDCGDILLREYRMEDVDAICALTQQPAILEFLPDWNASKEQRAYIPELKPPYADNATLTSTRSWASKLMIRQRITTTRIYWRETTWKHTA